MQILLIVVIIIVVVDGIVFAGDIVVRRHLLCMFKTLLSLTGARSVATITADMTMRVFLQCWQLRSCLKCAPS